MKKKELMFILVATFIVIIIWVIAEIIHTRPSQPLDPLLQNAIQPVTPTFDSQTLDRVNSIKTVPTNNAPLQPVPTPVPTAPPTPTATSEPILTSPPIASTSASPSGSLINPNLNPAL